MLEEKSKNINKTRILNQSGGLAKKEKHKLLRKLRKKLLSY